MCKGKIDVTFDFTMDSPGYWDGFWERKDGLGAGACDPDACSPTLQRYHQLLWSKTLPNGEAFELLRGAGHMYLNWRGMHFGSDSILASFRYWDNRSVIEAVKRSVPDYQTFMEDFLHRTYTIGGMIIFPKHHGSMNQRRGTDKQIRDRWDLTMECIRRFYNGENSPLSDVMEHDRDFYALFNNFKGYVDFFYLQDCVTEDYKQVRFWLGDGNFSNPPLPQTVDEYLAWIAAELDFLDKRNARIKAAIEQ
ncbi:DUF6994 family protein [Selenomonas ruminantium]|uniref:Uncharacterized protein n=1 Tax=Selenomonas ruminantium TaxID=971 RepID=A0A1K1M6I0_SELRU|nr:hypothetical protein [Selenomonas ruminantium]SFW18752.1 hypothetical protein SAMN02910323_0614 [Selenomonas ruminantium]